MSVQILEATAADWPRIWPLVQQTAETGETYTYDPAMTSEAGRVAWLATPPGATVVAVDGHTVLGTARMGPNRDGPGEHVGTASFIVAQEARGRGVGRALGEHVVEWHRAHGFRGICFNAVVETNTSAVRLWTSLGFEVVGRVPGAFRHPRHGYVPLLVMFLPLVADEPTTTG